MTADDIITDMSGDGIDVNNLKTREDVELVLDYIGAPGDHRDLKDEVVGRLFTRKSPQGFTTVDDLKNYSNY